MKTAPSLIRIDDNEGWNFMIISNLTEAEYEGVEKHYSIKYVSEGKEIYKIDKRTEEVVDNSYLITNPTQEIEAIVESSTDVTGVCYFFDPGLIQQIRTCQSSLGNIITDGVGKVYDSHIEFDNKTKVIIDNTPINSYHTLIHQYLIHADKVILDRDTASDYLMNMAESLVAQQMGTLNKLNDLNTIKSGTKAELYKRIQIGRHCMHANIKNVLPLKDIAKSAMLSEYHFHRCFRAFFGLTPHQYYGRIRMLKAQELFREGKQSKIEIAMNCGFSDVKYFAKVFRTWKTQYQYN